MMRAATNLHRTQGGAGRQQSVQITLAAVLALSAN
jgi:hypothetical protein